MLGYEVVEILMCLQRQRDGEALRLLMNPQFVEALPCFDSHSELFAK